MISLLRFCAAALAVTTLPVGCALIVGDPVGHRVFDAGEPTSEDGGGHPGTDAGATDATKDAHHHDATASRDVATLEGGTVDARDALNEADAIGIPDGKVDAGFCATFTVPAGTTAYCEDFDENPDATSFGSPQVFPGSSLGVQYTVSKSHPGALLAVSNPPVVDGGAEVTLASLETMLGTATSYTLECDVMLSPVPAGAGFDYIGGLLFGNAGTGSGVTIEVYSNTPNGHTPMALVESSPGASKIHPPVSVALNGWFHLVLNVTNSGMGFVDTFSINGEVLEANYRLAGTFTDSDPAAYIGWSYVSVAGGVTAYFDNVVVMWK